jgi:hypothetical protein
MVGYAMRRRALYARSIVLATDAARTHDLNIAIPLSPWKRTHTDASQNLERAV